MEIMLRDVVYFISLILGISAAYWKTRMDIRIIRKEYEFLQEKHDLVNKRIEEQDTKLDKILDKIEEINIKIARLNGKS